MDPRLEHYIELVRRIVAQRWSDAGTVHRVRDAARELVARPLVLDPAARAMPAHGYGRNLLWRDPDHGFVVIAMAWPPGLCGAPHDHGTWGVVAVVEGEVTITDYERDDDGRDGDRAVLREVGTTVAGPGSVATVLPPHRDFHRVGNASPTAGALSLHTYGADVRHCHVFDADSSRLISMRLDYTSVLPGTSAC
ncbi:MAG TPA: hypothetical protein VK081_13955 [Planctomycetota bacterium]|nr:hypothetical protein [Planctomycetota bacterium]